MRRHSHHLASPPADYWKPSQAYILAVVTLMLGLVGGYLFRGSSTTATAAVPSSDSLASTPASLPSGPSLSNTAIQPLLEQLKSRPNDPELLASIGNQYYDNRDYTKAIEYYERSLKLTPRNANVRTDMGTAIWYSGDPDRAIREYEQALKDTPNHPQTLFNMGVVKWQGKHDGKAALGSWEKLLAADPTYADRQKVEAMMQQVRAELK
jgi:cytochrome c-type biogenesis protein CcmH/NrfG